MELTLEQHIIHQLLLRSSMGKEVGLFHGKMGLILFFVHYFKHSGQQVYDDTADELMDELKAEIHTELPVGFATGIAGVGWGVEYLIQNGFVVDDSLKVCRSIDRTIMEKDLCRVTDYSLDTGLEGILHFVLAHIKGVMKQHAELPFDTNYLSDLYYALTTVPKDIDLPESFKILSTDYSSFYENRTELDYSLQLTPFMDEVQLEKEGLNRFPLGLKKGMAGFLLKKLIGNRL